MRQKTNKFRKPTSGTLLNYKIYGNFSNSLLDAFQKQVQTILKVNFITNFLMDLQINFRVRIIFSELIHKNLVTSSKSQGLLESATSFPIGAPKDFGKMQQNSVQFNNFGVRHNQTIHLTTFTDSLKKHFLAFESTFLCKICKIFHVKNVRYIVRPSPFLDVNQPF